MIRFVALAVRKQVIKVDLHAPFIDLCVSRFSSEMRQLSSSELLKVVIIHLTVSGCETEKPRSREAV